MQLDFGESEMLRTKVKSTICSLVAGLLIASASYASGLPERFKDYASKYSPCPGHAVMTEQGPAHIRHYDIDGDGVPEVEEFRPIVGISPTGQPLVNPHALIYVFDLNDNNKFEQPEIYIDEAMDGLNGNEKQLILYNSQSI